VPVQSVTVTLVTVMTISIANIIILFFLSCYNDFTMTQKEVIQVIEVEDTSRNPEVIVEYFEQPSKPESLDVLFVLDTSCSMSDDFEKVSIGMELLRGDIEMLTNDYNMAIINSSLKETYFAGTYNMDTDSIEFLLAPFNLARDSFEQAFASHYLFATGTEEGETFLRPGIPKLYIYISDEEEQSPISVDLFKKWLDSYHGETQYDVITIAIKESSDTDCARFADNIGYKYDQLAQYFNKRSIDFCGDWQLALADSSFLLREITHMQLSHNPIEDTIVVYLDGVKQEDWYYLWSTNTVYFEFEIPEGSIIKVGYNKEGT